MNIEEKIKMSERSLKLLDSMQTNVHSVVDTINKLEDLSENSDQTEVNRHSIVYNLSKIKLQQCVQELNELRIISISLGMFDTLNFISEVEPIIYGLRDKVNKNIELIRFISELNNLIDTNE